jgi:hypothetical protein
MSKHASAWVLGFGFLFAGCDPGDDDTTGTGGTGGTGGRVSTPTPTGGVRAATGGTSSRPVAPIAGSTSTPSGATTITDRYDYRAVARDSRGYIVQNNVWGSNATQTLSIAGTSFEIVQQTGSNGTNGGPVSYPSVFIGANYDRVTLGSNLPKQVSALTTIDTGWSISAGTQSGVYNAAYDVWFSTGASGDPQAPSGGYLMVWFYDPANAQPIGGITASTVSIPGISGTWDVWVGPNAGRPCISYVSRSPITQMTFDLNLFIQDAVKNRSNTIQASWYLTNVFAGFEVWSGGVGLRTHDFYAVVH